MDDKQELKLNIEEAKVDTPEIESEYDALKKKLQENGIDTDPFEEEAKKRADKILKKNRRELKRLQNHAYKCLMELNKEGYIYSIGKFRTIIKKPADRKTLEMLYETSVASVIELVKDAIKPVDSETK